MSRFGRKNTFYMYLIVHNKLSKNIVIDLHIIYLEICKK